MSTTTLFVAPMQWAGLKDIDDVEPLGEDDYECLSKIRDVLKSHGKQERFGIALLHKHFDLAPDEVLVEHSDKENRVLTTIPIKTEDAGKVVDTVWQLVDGDFRSGPKCVQGCAKSPIFGDHIAVHKRK